MIGGMAALLLAAGGPVGGVRTDRPQVVVALTNCQTIADEKLRVACYDREVAAFDAAERDRKIVVLDQQQVKTTRRSLFGFALPALKMFGGGSADDPSKANEEANVLDTVVTAVARQGDGQVAFTVEGGARWVQADDRTLSLVRVRPGTKVSISKGAFGSYFAAFERAITIRVHRVG